MRKFIGALMLFTLVLTVVSCEKEKIVDVTELPAAGSRFLTDHFAGVKVLSVAKEKDGLQATEYQVLLDNRIEITFDKDGNWKEVDGAGDIAIPTSFILPAIVTYVQKEYPTAGINGIDKEKNTFDVDLTNGLDLVFNAAGDFVRIDP